MKVGKCRYFHICVLLISLSFAVYRLDDSCDWGRGGGGGGETKVEIGLKSVEDLLDRSDRLKCDAPYTASYIIS